MSSRGEAAGQQPGTGAAAGSHSQSLPAAAAPQEAANSKTDAPLASPVDETILVQNERKKVNVAARTRQGTLSPLWKYVIQFSPPLSNGKNVICRVLREGERCGHLMKYVSKNGTGVMSNHMKRNHPNVYNLCMEASSHSSATQRERGAILEGASSGTGMRMM